MTASMLLEVVAADGSAIERRREDGLYPRRNGDLSCNEAGAHYDLR